MKTPRLLIVGLVAIAGCELRPSPDPEQSFFHVTPIHELGNGQGEPDWSSPSPRVLAVRLGAKECAEARAMNPDDHSPIYALDRSLELYIAPELKRRGFCPAGYSVRPGVGTGTKRGDMGFLVDCRW